MLYRSADMLIERIEDLERDVEELKRQMRHLPTWYPITKLFAEECGYKTTDGLRKYCQNNLHPDAFIKKGKLWYIHKTALHSVKFK